MSDLFDLEAQRARLSRRDGNSDLDEPTLPSLSALRNAESTLHSPDSPEYLSGRPQEDTVRHIINDIIPALNGQGRSGRYYGFVTGGTLPIAEWADNVATRMDQNVQVHLPDQTIATALEDAALEMVISLLRLGEDTWKGRTFTTGATASNVLGLACGREAGMAKKLGGEASVGELGLLRACLKAGVTDVQVLTSAGHSSLSKAASVVGFGRSSVKELRVSNDEPWRLDLVALEAELKISGTLSVIAISAGEVNMGRYAVNGLDEMTKVRALADKYGAWIHVDGGKWNT